MPGRSHHLLLHSVANGARVMKIQTQTLRVSKQIKATITINISYHETFNFKQKCTSAGQS